MIYMSYEITLNWNITTYEVTATGGREAPTIITSCHMKGLCGRMASLSGQQMGMTLFIGK